MFAPPGYHLVLQTIWIEAIQYDATPVCHDYPVHSIPPTYVLGSFCCLVCVRICLVQFDLPRVVSIHDGLYSSPTIMYPCLDCGMTSYDTSWYSLAPRWYVAISMFSPPVVIQSVRPVVVSLYLLPYGATYTPPWHLSTHCFKLLPFLVTLLTCLRYIIR